jgi:hypothetical protein
VEDQERGGNMWLKELKKRAGYMWITPEQVENQEKGGKHVGPSSAGEDQEKDGKHVGHSSAGGKSRKAGETCAWVTSEQVVIVMSNQGFLRSFAFVLLLTSPKKSNIFVFETKFIIKPNRSLSDFKIL